MNRLLLHIAAAAACILVLSKGGGGAGLVAEALSTAPNNKVVVITHAAGRMGKLLALQIHEDPDLREYSTVRAVCRSEEEAYTIRCDLGGMIQKDGKFEPIPCDDWLETIVITEDDDIIGKLDKVFEDADAAVLCDASHNELEWQGSNDFRVRVPSTEQQNDLSARLLKEIDAASTSKTLERIVLRSSMGCGSENNASYDMMGGDVALTGPRLAEMKLTKLFSSSSSGEGGGVAGRSCVVLRLGALTDDPGMVPLIFDGTGNDVLLQRRMEGDDGINGEDKKNILHPPILSRADAARVSSTLLKKPWFGPQFCTLDCAWMSKYGRNSVGREETILHASRQNLAADILTATAMATAEMEEEEVPTV